MENLGSNPCVVTSNVGQVCLLQGSPVASSVWRREQPHISVVDIGLWSCFTGELLLNCFCYFARV